MNTPRPPVPRLQFLALAAVLVFFFVSGACGLLYQVVWTRKLVLLLGSTSLAVSTVLSVFFLGLGLGSLWGGRLADRWKNLLGVYGWMEIAIGIWAAAFLFLLSAGEDALVAVLQAAHGNRTTGLMLRAALAAGLILVPVTLMGATLPILARFVTTAWERLGGRIGALYTVNTLGAVAGCAAAGFVLLPTLGYSGATWIGAALNVTVGVFALAMSRFPVRTALQPTVTEPAKTVDEVVVSRTAAWLVVVAFAVSGFCSLGLEVVWTRWLSIVFLGTTYAFTTMLTTVLCGIALGSAIASLVIDRIRYRVLWFGSVQVLTGLATLWMLRQFPALPDTLAEAQRDAAYSWDRLVFTKFALSFSVLLLPTVLFGASFPFAVRIVAASRDALGWDVGRLYSANTFGGVLGALAAGYVFIPRIGTHRGVLLLAALLIGMGLWLILAGREPQRKTFRWAAAAAAAALAFGTWLSLPPDVNAALNRWYVPHDHETIYLREGVEGTVLVTAPREETHGSGRYLWINAVQATASIEKGIKMNRFDAALPPLFDRDLNTALFMCFGTGITVGTLAQQPFEEIDAVEISPDVLDAATLFEADNFRVWENPRVNFITDDGRNFLLSTTKTYDLITFEPMPLALSGVSAFYTAEYYELCLEHLNPGGLVTQWVPLHSLSPEIVKSLCATFLDTFPDATAWFVNSDLFLIGSNEPLALSWESASHKLKGNPELWEALKDVYLGDLVEMYASYFMGPGKLAQYTAGAPIMTDDQPWAEFIAPKYIYGGGDIIAGMIEELKPYREAPLDLFVDQSGDDWRQRSDAIARRSRAHINDLNGLAIYYGGSFGSEPEVEFRKSLEIDPNDLNAQYYLAEVLIARGEMWVRWDEFDKAVALLEEAKRYAQRRPDLYLYLGDAYHEKGEPEKAAEAYTRYLAYGGAEPRATERTRKPAAVTGRPD